MSKVYERLEYVGRARYLSVQIYPSHKEVRITNDTPYIFEDSDILNADSIKYYESLYSLGLRLVKSDTVFNEKPQELDPSETPINDPNVIIPDGSTTGDEDIIPSDNVIPPTQTFDETKNDETSNDNNSESDNSSNDESNADTSIINTSELIEYLDLNYEVGALQDMARSVGIKRVQSSWDKSTLINKILEANTEYVMNLIKDA